MKNNKILKKKSVSIKICVHPIIQGTHKKRDNRNQEISVLCLRFCSFLIKEVKGQPRCWIRIIDSVLWQKKIEEKSGVHLDFRRWIAPLDILNQATGQDSWQMVSRWAENMKNGGNEIRIRIFGGNMKNGWNEI